MRNCGRKTKRTSQEKDQEGKEGITDLVLSITAASALTVPV